MSDEGPVDGPGAPAEATEPSAVSGPGGPPDWAASHAGDAVSATEGALAGGAASGADGGVSGPGGPPDGTVGGPGDAPSAPGGAASQEAVRPPSTGESVVGTDGAPAPAVGPSGVVSPSPRGGPAGVATAAPPGRGGPPSRSAGGGTMGSGAARAGVGDPGSRGGVAGPGARGGIAGPGARGGIAGPGARGGVAGPEETPRSRWPAVARSAAWATAIVGVIVVMGVFIFPTRTWLEQRNQLVQTAQEVRLLDQQNAGLSAEAAKLQTDAEVERLARERYQLVRPGDQVFAIGPAPTPPTTVPSSDATHHPSGGVWHALTSWLP